MARIDSLRNRIINKGKVKLTEEQILMLKLSDNDIKQNQIISQSQLDKEDIIFLKEL